jgi:hypothetical protein
MTRKQKTEEGWTLKPVTISAGSKVTRIPFSRSDSYDYVSVLVSHDKNATSEWRMPFDEAVRMGIVPTDLSGKPREVREPEKPKELEEDYAEQVPESFA